MVPVLRELTVSWGGKHGNIKETNKHTAEANEYPNYVFMKYVSPGKTKET